MASKKLDLSKNIQQIATRAEQPAASERVPPVNYPISTRAGEQELPAVAGTLSTRLQEIARQYIGARRRSGEALLEAARWLSEARAEAQHGEWQTFLEATSTSDDTAERLLNIHTLAMQNPQFAESVRSNWIGQSVAALLARPSTPPEVATELLSAEQPPRVADVQRVIRQKRQSIVAGPDMQNPQIADFGETTYQHKTIITQQSATSITALDVLQEVAIALAGVEQLADSLSSSAETEQALAQIEQSLQTIRRAVAQRS